MNNNIRPGFLKKGDKAIIVSPSGNINPLFVDAAKLRLESWGIRVETTPHAKTQNGRFCGTIDERLDDLQSAIDDKEAKLILCSRGGYGIIHLLDKLNFEKIVASPKWLVGYSDITALHQVFLSNGIMSLHAPMAKHLAEEAEDDAAASYMKNILFGDIPQYEENHHPLNIQGNSEGVLFGGNLSVLCSIIGSEYSHFPKTGILFIEDIAERPYQIDRMMWTLKLSGILASIKGLIIGKFTEYEEDTLMYAPVYQSIKSMMEEYHIPVAFGFPVGHITTNYPLLHGSSVRLSVDNNKATLQMLL